MTEPVTSAASSAPAAAPTPQAHGGPSRFDPAETRMFAHMMQGVPAPPATSAPHALRDAAMAYAAQLTGNVRSYEEMRRSMLEAIDLRDPIKTMFALTDHSMEAHMTFAKLHISTGLASAATSLFSTLLKNQQ
ncbi:MAG TPA: hypothetical protein VNO84_08550 [Burkholderiaceae bacterium]|nr:hypothetical protein [Burkholderiaceae bacterium]